MSDTGERRDWLVKFGFGAVQESIAQARKLRDLAAGSRLISDMTRVAIENAVKPGGAAVLLPVRWDVACPHQSVVALVGKSASEVREFGRGLKGRTTQFRCTALGTSRPGANAPRLVTDAGDLPKHQFETAHEFYWVAVAVDSASSVTRSELDHLSQRFEERRHTRSFGPLRQLETSKNYGCAQCGTRVALHERVDLDSAGGLWAEGERLCAVCCGKRIWSLEVPDLRSFPSTPRLAYDRFLRDSRYAPARHGLQEAGFGDEAIGEVIEYSKEELERLSSQPDQSGDAKRWKQAASLLWGSDEAPGALRSLSPYYAHVVFDGDEMGQWFRGKRFKEGIVATKALHNLGTALAAFSAKVKSAATRNRAHVVYLGGDDGFVLSPLDGLLPLVEAIKTLWDETLAAVVEDSLVQQPTLSLHASVVHVKAPLQSVVRGLHERLAATKDQSGRDAFSFECAPRGGAPVVVRGKWSELGDLCKAIGAFSIWRSGDFLRPAAGELRARGSVRLASRLLSTLEGTIPPFFNTAGGLELEPALDWELRRVGERSGGPGGRPDEGAAGTSAETWKAVREWLLRRAVEGVGPHVTGRTALSTALEAVPFLARELDWEES